MSMKFIPRKGKEMKVRILNAPTIAPAWIGKIGEIKEHPFNFYMGKCYKVAIDDQELALYENEFEPVDDEEHVDAIPGLPDPDLSLP
jgi:hypothetical protein